MANDKFKVHKVIGQGYWYGECSVFLARSQIILNNENNKTYAVNEMANIGTKTINGVIVKLICYDANGNTLAVVDNCAYQDMDAAKQTVFGGNNLFEIADGTENIAVIVKAVTYFDGTVWENQNDSQGIVVDNPVKIDTYDALYEEVFRRCKQSEVIPKIWASSFEGGWRCTCSQINSDKREECTLCGASKEWILNNTSRVALEKSMKEKAVAKAIEKKTRQEEEQKLKDAYSAWLLVLKSRKKLIRNYKGQEKNNPILDEKQFVILVTALILFVVLLYFGVIYAIKGFQPKKVVQNNASSSPYVVQLQQDTTSNVTETTTQTLAEKVTETTTQKPTEKVTETTTQKPTEKVTETTTQKPTEKMTETTTQKPTEKVTETTTQKPTEKATEKPTQKETEKATEKATEKTTEKQTETTKSSEDGYVILELVDISSANKATMILYEAGLISSVDEFNAYLTNNGLATRIMEGTFRFKKGMSMEEVARVITGR